jgi:hypothetical protein
MELVLSIFVIVVAMGTVLAFGWTSSLLYRRTSVRELIAITTLWALVVGGWVNFVAIAKMWNAI